MNAETYSVLLLCLIAVALVAIRLAMSKIQQGINDSQEMLKSELSEVRKLLEKK